ncbi:MAG: patatin-like phospholipase family protein [Microbacter sp.]
MKKIYFLLILIGWISTATISLAQKYQVGICLSGGGALGFAHIGVLQALEESGIYPQIISGTSIGAVVGVFYAAGYSPHEILEIIQHEKLYKTSNIIRFHLEKRLTGFSTHKAICNVIKKYIPADSYSSLAKPFYSCATNLSTGNATYTSSGDELNKWVAASASIPGIFEVVKIDSCDYVDGGVLNNLPAQPIRPLCKEEISVVVAPFKPYPKINSISDVIHAVLSIMSKDNIQEGIKISNDVIYVPMDPHLNMFSFGNYKNIYFAGYNAGKRYLADHPELLKFAIKPPERQPLLVDTVSDVQ